jgi:hypothetical protein
MSNYKEMFSLLFHKPIMDIGIADIYLYERAVKKAIEGYEITPREAFIMGYLSHKRPLKGRYKGRDIVTYQDEAGNGRSVLLATCEIIPREGA